MIDLFLIFLGPVIAILGTAIQFTKMDGSDTETGKGLINVIWFFCLGILVSAVGLFLSLTH